MLARLTKSSLFRAASIYGMGNLLRQVLPVLLVPVLTRYLSPEDYGVQAIFLVLVGIFTPLVGLTMHGAISRKYFDREQLDFPSYVFNCLLVLAGGTLLAFVAIELAGGLIARAADFPREWLWAVVFVTSTQMLNLMMMALLQVSGRAAYFSTLQVLRASLLAGLTAWFVVGFGKDWRGTVWAQVVVGLLFAIYSVAYFVRSGQVRAKLSREYIVHAVGYGGPLILHALSGVIIQAIDRIFVSHYSGLAQTGIYSIGYQLGALIGLAQDSFNQAWQPWFFERLKADKPKDKRQIVQFTYLYFVVIALAALALGVLAPFILSILVSSKFQGAYVHVIWVGMGYAFNGMYKMVSGYIFYAEKTGWLGWLTAVAALTNVGLNMWLVPRYGAIGAAQATAGAFFVSFALSWIAAAKVYPMPWLSAFGRQDDEPA